MVKESDWKIFKEIKKRALERFCQKANNKLEKILNSKAESHHSKYIALFKVLREEDKKYQKFLILATADLKCYYN